MSVDSLRDAVNELTRTRLAMIALVERGEQRQDSGSSERSGAGMAGWLDRLKRGAGSWWRRQPARAVLELARPALSGYAARNPARFLGIAAAAGAVFVAARLWRLIPVTGLLMALVKSSGLAALLASALTAAGVAADRSRPG